MVSWGRSLYEPDEELSQDAEAVMYRQHIMGFSAIKPAPEQLIFWENMKTTEPILHSNPLPSPPFSYFQVYVALRKTFPMGPLSNMPTSCIFCLLAFTEEAHKTY